MRVLDFPIRGVEEFLGFFDRAEIKSVGRSEIEIEDLSREGQVYLLKYEGE